MNQIEYLSKKNIGAREDQQDSVNITQHGNDILIALGDGMGGHSGGAMASNFFVTTAQDHFENSDYSNPKSFFDNIIYESENKIDLYSNQSGEDPHTTSTLALYKNNTVYFSNIGDSRVYVFTRKGLQKRTRDHSVTEMLYQMGEISENEMATHPDQNKLTKSLGPGAHEKASYYEYKLNENEEFIILVCSDGLWEYVQEKEMMYWVFNFDLENALTKMIEIARSEGGAKGDNISVAVMTNRKIKKKHTETITSTNSKQKNSNKALSITIILSILIIASLFATCYFNIINCQFFNNATIINEKKATQQVTKKEPLEESQIEKQITNVEISKDQNNIGKVEQTEENSKVEVLKKEKEATDLTIPEQKKKIIKSVENNIKETSTIEVQNQKKVATETIEKKEQITQELVVKPLNDEIKTDKAISETKQDIQKEK